MQVVAASAIPSIAPLLGIKNPTQANSEVLAYIGFAALALIVIRLLCAPFFIWKEDQAKIALLQSRIDQPSRLEREAMIEYSVELRKRLSADLAAFIGGVMEIASPSIRESTYSIPVMTLIDRQRDIANTLQQLSFDHLLRVSVWNIVTFASSIAKDASDMTIEPERLRRLKTQAKLTHALIHRSSEHGQIVDYANLAVYLESVGVTLGEV